jgi:ParB family chromosome partitioning protein
MARKFGLGRGLSALIPEEIFGTKDEVKDEPPVEQQPEASAEPAPVEPEAIQLDVPVETDVPVEQDISVEPDMSDEAAITALTSIDYAPVEPEVLVESEEPVEPEVPVESEEPVEPEVPVESEEPVEPEIPVESEVAGESEVAVEPEEPVEPEVLVESEPQPSLLEGVEPEVRGSPLEVPVSEEGGDLPLSRDAVVQIAVDKLVPNPSQPRKNFDETELQELADSIKEHGVIMPIIAADTGDGNYTIIAGERRTRAARLAGLEDVPVIIRDYTDLKRMEVSLIENIQRSDLNPIEEATAYKNLMDFSSLSQGDLAARVGKNRSTVTNALRLLKLSAEVQKSLETGEISSGHARALLSVTDKKQLNKLFNEITAKGLSVREAEKKASALNSAPEEGSGASGAEKVSKRPPEIVEMEEKFIEKLGTKVTIDGGLEKGRIHIEYYSMEDLDRLYELLGDI